MEQSTHKLSPEARRGEQGKIPSRRQRVYMKHRQWYFVSRDGTEHGPYQNLTEARRELALFLRRSGGVTFKL